MTLDQLIDTLTSLRDLYGDNVNDYGVRGALQPNYPMLASLMNVCVDHSKKKVYLAMSDNESYGCPHDAWDEEEIGEYAEDDDDGCEEENED